MTLVKKDETGVDNGRNSNVIQRLHTYVPPMDEKYHLNVNQLMHQPINAHERKEANKTLKAVAKWLFQHLLGHFAPHLFDFLWKLGGKVHNRIRKGRLTKGASPRRKLKTMHDTPQQPPAPPIQLGAKSKKDGQFYKQPGQDKKAKGNTRDWVMLFVHIVLLTTLTILGLFIGDYIRSIDRGVLSQASDYIFTIVIIWVAYAILMKRFGVPKHSHNLEDIESHIHSSYLTRDEVTELVNQILDERSPHPLYSATSLPNHVSTQSGQGGWLGSSGTPTQEDDLDRPPYLRDK